MERSRSFPYWMLTVLLMSPFSAWKSEGAVSLQNRSSTMDEVRAGGLKPQPPHHHTTSTLSNPNGTHLWFQSFAHLMNTILHELNPVFSEQHANPPPTPTTFGPTTPTFGPPTSTESSDSDDWDLDDFDSCRDVMQSLIRRLTT